MTAERSGLNLMFDMLVAVLIGVAAATIAFHYVAAHYAPNTGDDDTFRIVSAMVAPYREDLIAPCLERFGVAPAPAALVRLPEWHAFLTRKSDAFPCAALRGLEAAPPPYNFELHRHLHRAMSTVFAFTGARLVGFAYYQAIQYGIVLALLYGIFRLGMGRILAALAMVPLATSPRHLEMALAPIEYAKAPFFAACLLGAAVLVSRRLPARAAYAIAAATGLVVGVGFGFKPDVLVFAPFGLLAIALFYRPSSASSGRRGLVAAAYLVGVIVAGAPLIRTHFFGPNRSLLPIQVLGGMAPAFDQEYAKPAIYDYGVMFDDDYVIAQINSYNQRVNGSTEFGPFFSEAIQRGAIDLDWRLYRTFAADILLRTCAAILQVLQFVPGGAIAALLVLIWLCRIDRRLALFLSFTLAYMVGYVSLVFAPKHYFHLEFVPWWFAGCAISYVCAALWRTLHGPSSPAPADEKRPLSWAATAALAGAAVVVVGGSLMLARVYQDRQVRNLLASYVQPERFETLTARAPTRVGSAAFVVPDGVAAEESAAPAADDGRQPFLSPIVDTSYLALRLQCAAAGAADVVAVYRRPVHWRDSLSVPCERADQRWTVMWPVYQHAPQQLFAGFEYPDDGTLRLRSISRVRSLAAYPLLLRLRLPDDWRERPLHHELDLGKVSPARVRPMPAALSAPPPPLPPPAAPWDPPFVQQRSPLPKTAPRLDTWTALPGVSVTAAGERFIVDGNTTPYGYQLTSPAIAAAPWSRISVRVFGAVDRGRVAVGILDGAGEHWLLPPVWGRSDFVATNDASDHVFIVFANNRQPSDDIVATRFVVESVSYDVQGSALARLRSLLWPVTP